MRRFEFVEGTSAKFWMANVAGKTFISGCGLQGLGRRSWMIARSTKQARKALAGIAGANPFSQPKLGKALDC